MIDIVIQYLEALIVSYGPLGLFLAAITEEIIAPIPSSFVILSGGFAFLGGQPIGVYELAKLSIQVALPIAVGLTLGSLFWYGLARRLGRPILIKVGPYVGLSISEVERVEAWMQKSIADNAVLFISRAIPFMPALAVNLASGILRFPIFQYIYITFLATFLKAVILGFLGWQAGSLYREYSALFQKIEVWVLVFLLICLAVFIWYRRRKMRGQA